MSRAADHVTKTAVTRVLHSFFQSVINDYVLAASKSIFRTNIVVAELEPCMRRAITNSSLVQMHLEKLKTARVVTFLP